MKRWLTLILIAAAGLSLITLFSFGYWQQVQTENGRALEQATTDFHNRLESAIKTRMLAVTNMQAFMLTTEELPSAAQFDAFAAAILTHYPDIRALQYVDPDRVIRYIYPLAGNEPALNLDLTTRPALPYVEKAIAERMTTVNNPTQTVQGSLSVVARMPLYRGNSLLGLVQGVFDVSTIQADALQGVDPRFIYRLEDAAGTYFAGTEVISAPANTILVPVGDNFWMLTVGWGSVGPPSPMLTLAVMWGSGGALLLSLLYIINRGMVESETQVRRLARRNKVIMDTTPSGYLLVDASGFIRDANPAYCDLIGYQRDELVQMHINELEVTTEPGFVIERMAKVAELGALRLTTQHRQKNGRLLDIDASLTTLDEGNGRYIAAFLQDITIQKQTEKSLAEALAKWESLAKNVPNFIAIIDRNHKLRYLNHVQPGTEADAIIGTSNFDYIAPEYHDLVRQKIDHVFETGEPQQYEIQGQGAFGESAWYETFVGPLFLEEEIAYVTLISSVITARKEADARLHEQAELLANVSDAIISTDISYRIQTWNRAAENLYGWTAEEAVGAPMGELVPTVYLTENRQNVMQQFLENGKWSGEVRQNTKDGTSLIIFSSVTLLKDQTGQPLGAVAVNRNITEKKQVEETLEQHAHRLEILKQIDHAILSTLSKTELANVTLSLITELIICQRAAIVEIESGHQYAAILAVYSPAGTQLGPDVRIPLANYSFLNKLQAGQAVRLDDLNEYAEIAEIQTLIQEGMRSYLVAPMVIQSQFIGGLSLAANNVNAFSEEDVAIAIQVADHLAVALQQKRLYTQVQHRLQELMTLQEASLAFAHLLSPEEVGAEVIDVLERKLEYQRGAIFTIMPGGDDLYLLAHSDTGKQGEELEAEIRRVRSLVSNQKGISTWVALHGEVVRLGNVKADPRYVEADPRIQSELCVPLRIGGKTIGALNVESELPDAFTEHDERLLTTLANQTAVSLENARLYSAEMESRALAEALRDTAIAVNQARTLDEVVDAIILNTRRVIQHDAQDIMLVEDGNVHTIRVHGHIDIDYEAWQKSIILPVNTTPNVLSMMNNRKPLLIPDTHADASWIIFPETSWMRCCVTAPICTDNQTVGFINLYSTQPFQFTWDDANRLEGFAEQAATGIEKVRLIADLEAQAQILEDRVARRTAELAMRNQELETFTYTVSHDLKAPLRGIDGYSRLLLEQYAGQLDNDGRFFLKTIRKATLQMNDLIEDLLLYSRLERRKMASDSLSPAQLVQSLLLERTDELNQRHINVRVDLPPDSVTADSDSLAMALRNLLDNALKFTRDTPTPIIEIGGHTTGGSYIIWVRDNGVGFNMKFHDRIFEIFQRLHRAEEYPGTGVGLAIVQKAMERMNGRAWASSEPGQGATFYLEVPITP